MEEKINIGYDITNEDMVLMNILEEIEKNDDEESFNILKDVVVKKNGILYYPLSDSSIVGFDGMFSDVNKTGEQLTTNDLVAHAIANEELIMGYTTLTKKNFKGFISKIGNITGENLKGKPIKNVPIYNKVPTKVIGILPVTQTDDSEQQIIKYLLVCSKNTFMDLLYKVIFTGTFAGLLIYKFYNFIEGTIRSLNN